MDHRITVAPDKRSFDWVKYDEPTDTELRLRFADGGATLTLGSRSCDDAREIDLDAEELDALAVAIETSEIVNEARAAGRDETPKPAAHDWPHGDLVFWVETPMLVHRARCTKIGPYTGMQMNAEKLIELLGRTKFDVDTCRECAPFGRHVEIDNCDQPWIYHRDRLSQAAHRLNIVAAGEMIRSPTEMNKIMKRVAADLRRAATDDGDEPSQPI